jgi:hypothetical protein
MITSINEFRKQNENLSTAQLQQVLDVATPEQLTVIDNFQNGTKLFFLNMFRGEITQDNIDTTLQLMVNDVEGDESQLEPEHAAYAQSKGWLDAFNESASKPKYTIDELKDMFKKVIDDKDITTRTQGDKLVLVNMNGDRMVITTDGVVQDTAFGSASHIIKSNKLKVESVQNTNIESINEDESNPNYMVLGNISKMSRMLSEMAELLGTESLDEWAKDHIATSADDIEEVYNFLKSKK